MAESGEQAWISYGFVHQVGIVFDRLHLRYARFRRTAPVLYSDIMSAGTADVVTYA